MNIKSCAHVAALVLSAATIGPANAVPIDKYFVVNPIRVCNDVGGSCTTANTYSAQTQ